MSEILKLKETIAEKDAEIEKLVKLVKSYEKLLDGMEESLSKIDLGDE